MTMAQSGICGISAHGKITRPRICLIDTRKIRVAPFHSVGHVNAAYVFPLFKNGQNSNKKSSQVSFYSSKGQGRWSENASAPFFGGEYGRLKSMFLPSIVKQRGWKFTTVPRAAEEDDVPAKFRQKGYPPMKEKPKWHWRILAAIPYLLCLHICWMRSKPAFRLHPLPEEWKYFTKVFIYNFIARLPRRILTFYFIFGYLGIVRNNRWPHFFRFHVINGMLLEILWGVCGQFSKWLPKGLYWGKFGQHYWLFIFLFYWCTSLICISCALSGCYADVPFISDAAYMQIPT